MSSFFRNALFSLIAIVLSALLATGALVWAELAYRATGYNPNRGAFIDVNIFPYANYVVSTQKAGMAFGTSGTILDTYFPKDAECNEPNGVAARFNSAGYRGPEFPIGPKKPNEVRIIVTGGSASISWNIGERCTLDTRLKERLTALSPGTEFTIINLGSGGWKSLQELIAIELHGLRLDPDVVIHFSGFNDSYHPFFMAVDQPYSAGMVQLAFQRYRDWVYATPRQFLSEFRIADAVVSLLSPPVALDRPAEVATEYPEVAVAAKPGGSLSTKLHLPLDLAAIARRTDFDPLSREVVDNYMENERLMARAVATKGAVLISALQPALYLKNTFADAEAKTLQTNYAHTVNFTVQNYLRLREDLAALASSEPNVKFVDYSAAFTGMPEQMFNDNVHFNKTGYSLIADKLARLTLDTLAAKANAKASR
jgi:lysophospholipase L1-like esterase